MITLYELKETGGRPYSLFSRHARVPGLHSGFAHVPIA
jgi:hypothetical protein